MAKSQTLKFKQTVNAPAAEVFRALTQPTALREWFADVAFTEPRKAGRFYAAWNAGYYVMGEFTKVEPGRKAAFTWQGRGEPAATLVKVAVAAKKTGTAVTVEHEGVGSGKKWASAAESLKRLWTTSLENLQSVMETGEDHRVTLRPMLGISGMSEVDQEAAQRLNAPAGHGLRIDGTVPGLGAAAAGLRSDDIILSLAGHKVNSYAQLTTALAGLRAGDTVTVTLYRDGEKVKVDLTLSKRPLPDIPDSAAALSEAVRAIYNSQNAELDQVLAGATDSEADFRVEPGAWSIKETLAHLIHGERGGQQQIAELTTGIQAFYDGYGGNSNAWVQATVAALGSLAAMVAAYKQAQDETVALLAGLPDAFVARKASYWLVAYNALEGGFHSRDHFAQMSASLNAARAAAETAEPAGAATR